MRRLALPLFLSFLVMPGALLTALDDASLQTYSPHEPHVDELYDELLKLVPTAQATHVAEQDGDWNATSTWGGSVPGNGARVHIPQGRSVRYNRSSGNRIDWIRVDGTMRFATDRDTAMIVDTWVVTASGTLEIGTVAEPVESDVSVDIAFDNDGDISQAQDKYLLGRGLIACGRTRMHGAPKTTWSKLANRPQAGDTTLILPTPPQGWQVGDTIMLPGWEEDGTDAEHEDVALLAIDGNVLTVSALDSHHQIDSDAPEVFAAHAINLSRNIRFSNQEASADKTQRSGYVSFMRSHDVDIRYVEFVDIGRSDKRIPVDDPVIQLDGTNLVSMIDDPDTKENEENDRIEGSGSNPRRRHSVQFYRHGSWHSDRDPSYVRGCTMSGGPGWSFANIDSNVSFEDCAAVHFMAAGFATDIGAEQGSFRHNIAVENGTSMNPKDGARRVLHDNGASGDGFYFHGRNLVIEDNVAIDCNVGFVQHIRSGIYDPHQGDEAAYVHRDVLLMPPETTKLSDRMKFDRCSLVDVRRNQAYDCAAGFRVIKSGDGLQHHDMRNRLYRIETYNCDAGIHVTYVTKYSLVRPTIFANKSGAKWERVNQGILVGGRSSETTIIDANIVGYSHPAIIGGAPDKENKGPTDVLVVGGNIETDDIWMDNLDGDLVQAYDPILHQFIDLDDLVPGRLSFTQNPPGILPLPEDLQAKGDFYLKGTRLDSLGTEELEIEADAEAGANGRASYWDGKHLVEHFAKGYYTTTKPHLGVPAGTKVLPLVDLFVDRHTNAYILHKFLVSIPAVYEDDLGPELGEIDPQEYLSGGVDPIPPPPTDGRVIDLTVTPGFDGLRIDRLWPSPSSRTLDAKGELQEGPFPPADPKTDHIFEFTPSPSPFNG